MMIAPIGLQAQMPLRVQAAFSALSYCQVVENPPAKGEYEPDGRDLHPLEKRMRDSSLVLIREYIDGKNDGGDVPPPQPPPPPPSEPAGPEEPSPIPV